MVPDGDVTRIVTRNTNTGQVIVQRVARRPARRPAHRPAGPDARRRRSRATGWGSASWTRPARPPATCFPPERPPTPSPPAAPAGPCPWSTPELPSLCCAPRTWAWTRSATPSWTAGLELQLDTLEHIRRQAAVRMGLAATPGEAARAVPKVAVVAAPAPSDAESDVAVAVMLSMGKPHPALAITGSIALTLAARTPGSLLGDITGGTAGPTLRLRTPAGVIGAAWSEERDGSLLVGVDRTARTIATTTIHLPEALGTAVDASLASATR